MLATRPLGQGAASKKYDMLTALGAYACAGSKFQHKLVLRFITLVTARYNWQRDELSIGRTEIARLWQVNERTVKRELAKLKDLDWVTVKRPAARGRVTTYSIDWAIILRDTRESWDNVGPDFTQRLTGQVLPEPRPTVIAFPGPTLSIDGETEWDQAQGILAREDPAFHASWLTALRRRELRMDVLLLQAPTAFHAQYLTIHALDRLSRAVSKVSPKVQRVVVLSPSGAEG
ncbi:hypothetical protein [Pseudoruegeria sp. SK021]|uniref:hypothetical protein n=1 Tax=Pseudoruegeria sp. SK021 TaxID=1933035 RepID=UPI000A250694|nr:hypothetical protein [Pseudoruegeria sp. SK021]OSP55828.1 hypothetical protein BV911_05495 [Pseudoruegeria sp. SK021]